MTREGVSISVHISFSIIFTSMGRLKTWFTMTIAVPYGDESFVIREHYSITNYNGFHNVTITNMEKAPMLFPLYNQTFCSQ